MAWVNVIPAEEATGDLKTVYEMRGTESGTISPPYEGLTNNGEVLRSLIEFSQAVLRDPSSLTALQREMIATYVSALNRCVF